MFVLLILFMIMYVFGFCFLFYKYSLLDKEIDSLYDNYVVKLQNSYKKEYINEKYYFK